MKEVDIKHIQCGSTLTKFQTGKNKQCIVYGYIEGRKRYSNHIGGTLIIVCGGMQEASTPAVPIT